MRVSAGSAAAVRRRSPPRRAGAAPGASFLTPPAAAQRGCSRHTAAWSHCSPAWGPQLQGSHLAALGGPRRLRAVPEAPRMVPDECLSAKRSLAQPIPRSLPPCYSPRPPPALWHLCKLSWALDRVLLLHQRLRRDAGLCGSSYL